MVRCINKIKPNSLKNRREKKKFYKESSCKTASHVVDKVNHAIITAAEKRNSTAPSIRLAKVGKNSSYIAANKLSNKKIRLLQKAAFRKLKREDPTAVQDLIMEEGMLPLN